MTAETIQNLKECAGNDGASQWETWFIHFRPIPSDWIVACHDVKTGEEVRNWGRIQPISGSPRSVPSWRREAWHKQLLKTNARHLRSVERAGYKIAV